ncbi:MAG: hypothetical protein A2Z83_08295 [Omnitrophica bacterium GWA2_52_8]|nr:MAG: hypothetical protein A2Z83_08295 [Omnitrophica bacterium GWA2_52_8]
MSSLSRFGFLAFAILLVATTGCSGSKGVKRSVNSLQAQVGVLTDEVSRLDMELQDMRSSMQSQPQSIMAPSISGSASGVGGGPVYRTPSGFELNALDIQTALKNAGYYSGVIDGKIGSGSESAIRAFQKDNGLEVDGVVGRNTWSRLKVYLKGGIK